jgi:hypothetical protein
VHLDTAGFTESGGASALSTPGASQDTGYSSLGVRAAAAYTLWNGMMLIPRASVAWQCAFGEINPATALAFAGIPGSNFNVTGVPIARNAALIDVGADLRINPQAKSASTTGASRPAPRMRTACAALSPGCSDETVLPASASSTSSSISFDIYVRFGLVLLKPRSPAT